MVLTPPMVFDQTDVIVLVVLDQTRGPSVARMRDFLYEIRLEQENFPLYIVIPG